MVENIMLTPSNFEQRLITGMTVSYINGVLHKIWSPETAYRKRDYTPELPSKGQCYVTALLVNRLFGGEIKNGKLKKNLESHYWNELEVGGEIIPLDLTGDQYGGDGVRPLLEDEFSRIRTVKKPNFTNKRFILLWEKFEEFIRSSAGSEE